MNCEHNCFTLKSLDGELLKKTNAQYQTSKINIHEDGNQESISKNKNKQTTQTKLNYFSEQVGLVTSGLF